MSLLSDHSREKEIVARVMAARASASGAISSNAASATARHGSSASMRSDSQGGIWGATGSVVWFVVVTRADDLAFRY